MNWVQIRPDFYVAENFFPMEEARLHLIALLRDGEDPVRGFKHPLLKPNRFHTHPKYPVKKYMGLGRYWDPLDYIYHEKIPGTGVAAFPIRPWMHELTQRVLHDVFPQHVKTWQAQAGLVNYYTTDSKLGLHIDKEEQDHQAPVIGISFGGTCRFLYEDEGGAPQSLLLPGNSVYTFGDRARLMRHGVGTTYKNTLSPESSGLLADKERLSVTLRKIFL